MRGTRYGDFSRFPRPPGDYRSVLMQQGRVQLDSDWNSQVELGQQALRSAVTDLIGGSGTPANAPGYGIVARGALVMRGDSAMVIDHPASLLPGDYGPFTVELWIEWRGGRAVLVLCGSAGGNAGYELVVDEDGTLECRVVREPEGEEPALIRSTTSIEARVPVHVALVFDGEYASIHADGRQLARGRVLNPRPVEDGGISVCGVPEEDRARAGLRGLLSGVRFWGCARSSAEVRAARQQPRGDVVHPDLLAWWRLDEPGSSALTDVNGLTAHLDRDRQPSWRLVDLEVEPGRYYVDGVACELAEPESYGRQACTSGSPLPARGTYLVYLDVWEESVSAVQDPELREVALGGLDTTVRTRIASCVRLAPLHDDDGDLRDAAGRALEAAARGTTGAMVAEHTGEAYPGNYLYRVEIHDSGSLERRREDEDDFEIDVVEIEVDTCELVLAEPWPDPGGTREIEIVAIDAAGADVVVRHRIAALDDGGRRVRLSSDPADVVHLESHRVRRHSPSPTFKWSRRNGADEFAVAPVEAGSKIVQLLPSGPAVTPLEAGDVVELLDAAAPFGGPAHPLLRVVEVREQDGTVVLGDAVPPGAGSQRPFLRRWDHSPTTADGAAPVADGWTELEDGIRVRFDPGSYRRGDYWWIVARQDLHSIEWPHRHGHPQAGAPDGVERRVAPLALLRLGEGLFETEDLRRLIRGAGAGRPGTDIEPQPSPVPDGPAEPPDHAGPSDGEPAWQPAGEGGGADGNGALEPDVDELEWGSGRYRFAVIGPAGASLPGFVPTGVEVVTKPHWRALGVLDVAAHDLRALVSVGRTILLATAEDLWGVYAQSGSAERLTSIPGGRHGFATCAVGDIFMMLGGRSGRARPDGRVLTFDVSSGAWSERAAMPRRLERSAAVVRSGRVHVIGGKHGGVIKRGVSAHHQVYDPESDRWSEGPRMHKRRADAAATAIDGRVHVLGGRGRRARHGPLASHEALGPDGAWHHGAPLPSPRRVIDTSASRGRHVVALAAGHGEPQSFLAYDHSSRSWDSLPSLPGGVGAHAIAEHAGGFLAAGRNNDGATVLHHLSVPAGWTVFVPETVLARSTAQSR